jgi:hypothetical protein
MHGQERPVADSVVSYRQGTQRAASRITPGCELQLTAALRVVVRSRRADFVKDDSCGGLTHGTVWQQVRNCLSLVFEFVVKNRSFAKTGSGQASGRYEGRETRAYARCAQYARMRDALNASGR